jgi:hypothetical protein
VLIRIPHALKQRAIILIVMVLGYIKKSSVSSSALPWSGVIFIADKSKWPFIRR